MNPIEAGEHDVLALLKPDTLIGALVYFVLFIVLAMILSRGLRKGVHASMTRTGHIAVSGCFLTKVETTAVTLELRLAGSDAAARDTLRSQTLSKLAKTFAEAKLGSSGGDLPTFA